MASRRDSKSIGSIMGNVDSMSDPIQKNSAYIISRYCEDLDTLMSILRSQMHSSAKITDNELEQHIIELANILYFVGSAQEDIGVKEDICKSIRQEVYSNAREKADGKTVADKTAQAELATQTETMVLAIYSRAYKKIKFKVDAGYEMLNSLKKVMNKRITEMELSNSRYINHSEVE